MTLKELRRIVSTLSNATFCRYWINWFDAAAGSGWPALMALCAINHDGSPLKLYEREMTGEGFVKRTDPDGLEFWFVKRVDEHGNAWVRRILS